MPIEANCGCKGIRKCLLCEEKGDVSELRTKQAKYLCTFCPHCGLCWPDASDAEQVPLYLGKIKVFENFITEGEENIAVSEIDRIPWVLSQSGRRKQDFGPKVNFKKKKVKIGEFKGFPAFCRSILQKFQNVAVLSDFQPVELCHLEYSPERGSAIDPHVDDFWLWGERLVTVNLSSSTIFTLLPFSDGECECLEDAGLYFSNLKAPRNRNSDRLSNDGLGAKLPHGSTGVQSRTDCIHLSDLNCDHSLTCGKEIRTFCGVRRSADVSVRVELPPRSLLVLAGCARYNWYHAIKRKDVISRRLAMTFRELSPEFLPGGKESHIGQDLLSVASNFCDFS